jgi:hypothetical protein
MSVSLGANGANYDYPETGDLSWGANATNFASAVSAALAKLGLGATLTADAVINIASTTKGVLFPQMTTTQRDAIVSPSAGLLIYNTTTNRFNFYSGGWKNVLINGETDSVGLGTSSPVSALDVRNGDITLAYSRNIVWGSAAYGANTPTMVGSTSSGNGFLAFFPNGSTSSEAIRFAHNGRIGIGTSSPSYQLELSTDSAGKPSTNVWTITSDERIKENITLADLDRCYEIVKNLPLKKYAWKYYNTTQAPDQNMLGWIAQDVQVHFPKAVQEHSFKISETESIDDCLNLNSDQINKALYGAVQKLQAIVETQQAKILELENRINTLEGN